MTNCIFSGNSATVEGGAFYNNTGSNPLVTHCTFSGNTAFAKGAGMLNTASGPTLINCTFSGNKLTSPASFGGAIQSTTNSSGTTTNCLFVGNSANIAGAIIIQNLSSTTLTNCTFAENSAVTNGGGLIVDSDSSATVDNCVFWDNSGGGTDESAQIFSNGNGVTVTYTDIMGLTEPGPFCADENGDPPCEGNIGLDPKFLGGASRTWSAVAVYCAPSCPADPLCHDCDDPLIEVGQTLFTDTKGTWTGNLVDMFLNPDTVQVLQSLIVRNSGTQIVVWGDFADLGQNNEAYQINDYRLDSSSASPCIDAADNNAVTICNADLDGNERFFDDPNTDPTGVPFPGGDPNIIVDMGAYEFGGAPELDCDGDYIADSCCPADFDGDEAVGAFDLAQLLGTWGDCPDPCSPGDSTCECRADLDNNCDVEAFDLALLLGSWGPCP